MTKRGMAVITTILAASFLAFPIGCGVTSTAVPEEVTVLLPDNTEVTVEAGSGAPSLANSKWHFYRVAENAQSTPFATIRFGPEGNLEAFEDNTLAANIFGDEIVFDNTRRATKQAGLQYLAATYGAETRDATGFTFEGRFSALAAGLEAGQATASASATYDPMDADVVRGTFSFSSRVTLISLPEANQDDQFPFMGTRVSEE
jgi:hypothetical protein